MRDERWQRRQIEDRGEDVLALADPGHRLDVERVEAEDGRGQKAARYPEPVGSAPQEEGRERMQEDVDGVVAAGVVSEEAPLDPEGRVDEGVVLGERARFEPDAREPAERAQVLVPRDVVVIVPDESPVADGGSVGRECGQDDDDRPEHVEQPIAAPTGLVRHGELFTWRSTHSIISASA